jgi:hypothetical protein
MAQNPGYVLPWHAMCTMSPRCVFSIDHPQALEHRPFFSPLSNQALLGGSVVGYFPSDEKARQ